MTGIHGSWPSCLCTQAGFGRPTGFGRPKVGDVRRPTWFGRPKVVMLVESCRGLASWGRKRRTSVGFRTSEEFAPSLSWGFRTSVGCRTSDVSDVRSLSDVRRPEQGFCPPGSPSCPSVSDVRTWSDVRSLGLWLLHLGMPPLSRLALSLELLLGHLPCT